MLNYPVDSLEKLDWMRLQRSLKAIQYRIGCLRFLTDLKVVPRRALHAIREQIFFDLEELVSEFEFEIFGENKERN